MKVSETLTVAAPVQEVFDVFSDIVNAEQRISGINKLEILSETKKGKGLKWRETRTMFGKEATEEMEITEYTSPHSYMVEAESHGTHYTTRFFFDEAGEGSTKVTWEFEGTPLTIGAKLMGFMMIFMKGSLKKAMSQDMIDLKSHIEKK